MTVCNTSAVFAGLVPAIHGSASMIPAEHSTPAAPWITGTSPAMTTLRVGEVRGSENF